MPGHPLPFLLNIEKPWVPCMGTVFSVILMFSAVWREKRY